MTVKVFMCFCRMDKGDMYAIIAMVADITQASSMHSCSAMYHRLYQGLIDS